ncbi:MAG TPA: ATP-binding protein [Fimbriimonadaceae bacterium]|nr:ATP-binding protein [Fimbriimonadaceae bacterium]
MAWLAITCVLLTLGVLYQRARLIRLGSDTRTDTDRLLSEGNRIAAEAANYRLKLNALSASSGAAILMLADTGAIVHSNFAGDDILGGKTDTLDQTPELRDFAMNAFRTGKPEATDIPLKGGAPRILRAFAYPFEIGLSGVPEVMLVLTDVTELRRLENVRRDYVATVSHELRSPLTSIRAMAELLQTGALDDPAVADKFLETIIRETDRLERISSDLLVLSNTESGVPAREHFDLREVLEDVYTRYEPEADQAGLTMRLRALEPLPVFASRDQMDQAVLNLVDNAIRYTPSGGRVEIRASVTDHEVSVSVEDTGIGIEESDLSQIFERFYRANQTPAGQKAGTGLGLSIVKNVAESYDGTVRVESELGRGSTFTITLPASRN